MVKSEIFVLYEKNSYFMIFILYHKICTLLKYSYFTEIFVLYQKIRTPDERVQSMGTPVKSCKTALLKNCHAQGKCEENGKAQWRTTNS